ncbi:MAG: hypothetical protein ABH954_02160 [Candidatus Omnitrophota bacterium]
MMLRKSLGILLIFLLFCSLGCEDTSSNKRKYNLDDSAVILHEIHSRSLYARQLYIDLFNNIYRSPTDIEYAINILNEKIDELDSFVCSGKYEWRRRYAGRYASIQMRNMLGIALEEGLERFHKVAHMNDKKMAVTRFFYIISEHIVYNPIIRSAVIILLALLVFSFGLFKFLG